MGLFGFLGEPTIVGETYTCSKANQKVIHTKHASGASTEQGQHKVED
jgi:hypothetical protein